MTSSNLWTDGNGLAGPLHDLLRVDITTAIGRCSGVGAPHRWPRCGCSTTPLAWSPAARPVIRSSCGWCMAPAAPGWTCAA